VEWSLLRASAGGLCTLAYLLIAAGLTGDRREKWEAVAGAGQIDYWGRDDVGLLLQSLLSALAVPGEVGGRIFAICEVSKSAILEVFSSNLGKDAIPSSGS
jgi:hypothetical protein